VDYREVSPELRQVRGAYPFPLRATLLSEWVAGSLADDEQDRRKSGRSRQPFFAREQASPLVTSLLRRLT